MAHIVLYPELGVKLNRYPAGPRYVAAHHGCECVVSHFQPERSAEVMGEIMRGAYDVVLLSGNTDDSGEIKDIVSEARSSEGSRTTFILGGPMPSLCPDSMLAKTGVDYVAVGDASDAVSEIIRGARPGEKVIREGSIDMASLRPSPIPIRDKMDLSKATILLSKASCPYRCSFCADFSLLIASGMHRSPSTMDVGWAEADIFDQFSKIFPDGPTPGTPMMASFVDQDCWGNDDLVDSWIDVCSRIIRRSREEHPFKQHPVQIEFWASVPSILRVLRKRSDAVAIMSSDPTAFRMNIGVESMSDPQLRRWMKPQTAAMNASVLRWVKDIGVPATVLSIHWDPWTTLEEVGGSWEAFDALQLGCPSHYGHDFFGRRLQFIPGSPLYSSLDQFDHRKDPFGYCYDWDFIDPRAREVWRTVFQVGEWLNKLYEASPGCSFCAKDEYFPKISEISMSLMRRALTSDLDQIVEMGDRVISHVAKSGLSRLLEMGVDGERVDLMMKRLENLSMDPAGDHHLVDS